MSLPAADDLFRPTAVPEEVSPARPARGDEDPDDAEQRPGGSADRRGGSPEARKEPSGRVRHDEKMTVYVTAEELLDLERTRLTLRTQGVSVDRGRLVREAVAIALADFEANGSDSLLVRRLAGS